MEHAPYTALADLQKEYLFSHPFENLDLFLNKPISLETDDLQNKILHSKRGGWCFELNGLLAHIMKEQGYTVRSLMSRNMLSADKPRTHQIILTEIKGSPYIVDAGFGGNCIHKPHPLKENEVINHGGLDFRLIKTKSEPYIPGITDPDIWVLQIHKAGSWSNLYGFTLEQFTHEDFLVANHFHQTSNLSPFTRNKLVIKTSPDKRWVLLGNTVKEYRVSNKDEVLTMEYELADYPQLQAELHTEAGIEITAEEARKLYCIS